MVEDAFQDLYPGKPKVLFIGLAQSSHTHGWINLLKDTEFNVRLFGLPGGQPPDSWWPLCYVAGHHPCGTDSNPARAYLYRRITGLARYYIERIARPVRRRLWRSEYTPEQAPYWSSPYYELCLGHVLSTWQPDIVHTLGIFDYHGGELYHRLRKQYGTSRQPKWVVHVRGGSDVAGKISNPFFAVRLKSILEACSSVVTDNDANIKYFGEIGIASDKISNISPIPGSGGVDVDALSRPETIAPSKRKRLIVYPKAYESPWSSSAPVIEALKTAWPQLKPCEIVTTATDRQTKRMISALPADMRTSFTTFNRIGRDSLLRLFSEARVMLAPSVIDGVPNCLYEAMASGAFPIVSPIETLAPIVHDRKNVLFARNQNISEIRDALITAMSEDSLVDYASVVNAQLVAKLANRRILQPRVVAFYHELMER